MPIKNRTSCLYIAVALIGLQMYSVLHMAEHGFDQHEHDGRECSIYLNCKHIEHYPSGKSTEIASSASHVDVFGIAGTECVRHRKYENILPRAPPLYS